jgi:hypothetical protein
MRVAMIGPAYVGLVSGACFADFGHDVTCVDKDTGKIAALARGEVPIYEPGLNDLVAANTRAGRLTFTNDLAGAVSRDRAALDHPRDCLALNIIELRGLPGRFAVHKTIGATRIEPQHPIPDDLKPNVADLRRLDARRTVIDRSKCQEAPGLRPVLRLLRQAA